MQSMKAVLNINEIIKRYLKDSCQLEVIDIYQQPELAKIEQIIAVPTLIKHSDEPDIRVIGSLSDHQRVLYGLGLGLAMSDGVS